MKKLIINDGNMGEVITHKRSKNAWIFQMSNGEHIEVMNDHIILWDCSTGDYEIETR